MDWRTPSGQGLRACAMLPLVAALSGCVTGGPQTAVWRAETEREGGSCGRMLGQGSACVANSKYHCTVWFPLESPKRGQIAPNEERGTTRPDAEEEAYRASRPGGDGASAEGARAEPIAARDRRRPTTGTDHEHQKTLVIPEPPQEVTLAPAALASEEVGNYLVPEPGP